MLGITCEGFVYESTIVSFEIGVRIIVYGVCDL